MKPLFFILHGTPLLFSLKNGSDKCVPFLEWSRCFHLLYFLFAIFFLCLVMLIDTSKQGFFKVDSANDFFFIVFGVNLWQNLCLSFF